MMIIAAAGLLVLGGGGGGAYFYFFSGAGHEKPAQAAAKPAIFVDLPDVLVNLSNAGSRAHAISQGQDRARTARRRRGGRRSSR